MTQKPHQLAAFSPTSSAVGTGRSTAVTSVAAPPTLPIGPCIGSTSPVDVSPPPPPLVVDSDVDHDMYINKQTHVRDRKPGNRVSFPQGLHGGEEEEDDKAGRNGHSKAFVLWTPCNVIFFTCFMLLYLVCIGAVMHEVLWHITGGFGATDELRKTAATRGTSATTKGTSGITIATNATESAETTTMVPPPPIGYEYFPNHMNNTNAQTFCQDKNMTLARPSTRQEYDDFKRYHALHVMHRIDRHRAWTALNTTEVNSFGGDWHTNSSNRTESNPSGDGACIEVAVSNPSKYNNSLFNPKKSRPFNNISCDSGFVSVICQAADSTMQDTTTEDLTTDYSTT